MADKPTAYGYGVLWRSPHGDRWLRVLPDDRTVWVKTRGEAYRFLSLGHASGIASWFRADRMEVNVCTFYDDNVTPLRRT